jgi:hypothetical protein
MVKRNIIAAIMIIFIVAVSLIAAAFIVPQFVSQAKKPFFVGVEIGWAADVAECKAVIDQVKNYTNMVIIASPLITLNHAALNETCDYAYQAGMYFMPYFSVQILPGNYTDYITNKSVTSTVRPFLWEMGAKEKYGEKFLGVYYNDEPGGQVLDSNNTSSGYTHSYDEIAQVFVQNQTSRMDIYSYLRDHGLGGPVFTSDYGLYWFDYKAGFDMVMCQFGWNNSRQMQIALIRGAAQTFDKPWGAIVTWTYDQEPYLESGEQLYNDMVLAYRNGANYVAIYDSSTEYKNSTLTQEHLKALQNFWFFVQQKPDKHGELKADMALELPQNYGFGFRSENDTVWGYIETNGWTQKMFSDVTALLEQYGSRLDIVYSDAVTRQKIADTYSHVLLWTET